MNTVVQRSPEGGRAPLPDWAADLSVALESGACGQFVLYGNVHDRFTIGDQFVSIDRFVEDEMLGTTDVILSYDLGNGLTVERGEKRLAQWAPPVMRALPQQPLEAVRFISRYMRYLGNLNAVGNGDVPRVAVIMRGIDQLLAADGRGFEHESLTYLVRDWALGSPFVQLPFASLLIADNLTDVEPLIVFSPQVKLVRVPLPSVNELQAALRLLQQEHPETIPRGADVSLLAAAVSGVSVNTLQQMTKVRAHNGRKLQAEDFAVLKKEMVERDAPGLIEFVESTRTLEDYHCQDSLRSWLRQDIALWRLNDVRALPMGYLLCGPIGTGKTFLVECLAGEAGVPVLKLKNFRDKWIGSSEANLEKIFRLIRALGRCIVFIDEADQTLGRRESGPGDSGLSGRLYSMIAQEMSNTANRGKVIWVFASSRPDLIEADLKRPGRIDVKIPILPAATAAQACALIAALAARFGLALSQTELEELRLPLPQLLTPGAAEALVVKAYRLVRTENLSPPQALTRGLQGYQGAVPHDVLELQIRLAIREATDLAFVPKELQHFADETAPER
ncbi:MAG TPA: ATP-binding protein [Steroidobacteraceae bacterium]|nr:ATP-binding protein [Steroidobacteraceae bacterium]